MDTSLVERTCHEAREKHDVPGLAVAVVDSAGAVHTGCAGRTARTQAGAPVSPATLFRLGSVTKPLTAAAVLRLARAGTIDLDRPVTAYLPSLAGTGYPGVEHITLRHLLGHTSGLPQDFYPEGPRDSSLMSGAVHDLLRGYTPIAPPGTGYAYSNPGYDLAGLVAATAAGLPYPELMRRQVFEPLGMAHTTFDPAAALTRPLALPHVRGPGGDWRVEHQVVDDVARHPSGFAYSNVLDMAAFLTAQLAGSRAPENFLHRDDLRLMHEEHARLHLHDGRASSLGFHRWHTQRTTAVGQDGDIGGYGAWALLLPEHSLGAVLLVNALPPDLDGFALLGRLLKPWLPRRTGAGTTTRPVPPPHVPTRPATETWASRTGVYVGPALGLVRLESRDGRPFAEVNGRRARLSVRDDGRYEGIAADGTTVSVGFPAGAGAGTDWVVVDGSLCRRFAPDGTSTPDPADLTAFTGTYHRIDTVTCSVRDDQLHLYSREDDREFPCTRLTDTLFAFDGGVIEFMTGPDGKVTGMRACNAVVLRRTGDGEAC
ncbi:serine hydrolase [Streptomyces paradoxus]|uniref:serine hydrolase n=1 Tax=Streptomyces paradoxus TaxID=66375 RepID=UPI00382C97E4